MQNVLLENLNIYIYTILSKNPNFPMEKKKLTSYTEKIKA